MRFLSRISVRLLAFNLLLVFLPAGGVLLLDTYESHLLEAQERTMTQEGRLLAAALEATGRLEAADARNILIHLGQRHIARLRVIDDRSEVIADSSALGPRIEPPALETDDDAASVRDRPLYRLFSFPVRLIRSITQGQGVEDGRESVPALPLQAIDDALSGRYGATTRVLEEDSRRLVVLHIAIPVRIDGRVLGVVLVSQSTTRVMNALYSVRLDVARVVLVSLAVAAALSVLMGLTIARPLARLRKKADDTLDRRGRLKSGFEPSRRRDEIGDLERALSELTQRLEAHLQATRSLASDLSHEFKNPLAAIRAATEVTLDEPDLQERRRLLETIQTDVSRLERLLSGAREIARIDAALEDEEREAVPLGELIEGIAEGFRLRLAQRGPTIEVHRPEQPVFIAASPYRIQQVLENLLGNAVGFSPPDGTVTVDLQRNADWIEIAVEDEGPGIPDEHVARVFERFFTYRPHEEPNRGHMGIGLAVVRAIVEGYGGSVAAGRTDNGGARFVVRFPSGGLFDVPPSRSKPEAGEKG